MSRMAAEQPALLQPAARSTAPNSRGSADRRQAKMGFDVSESESQLTYVMDIALTTEFHLGRDTQ
jgi:hypothetical protein